MGEFGELVPCGLVEFFVDFAERLHGGGGLEVEETNLLGGETALGFKLGELALEGVELLLSYRECVLGL